MEENQRGVENLSDDDVRWRKAKIREILKITKAGPYLYTATQDFPETKISYSGLVDEVLRLGGGPFYILYHRHGIVKVRRFALKKYWGSGQFYCTVFDDSLNWFALTDDNSEDSDQAVLIKVKISNEI